MNEQEPDLRLTISLAQKVNVGPYETADCSLFISGITQYTSESEIEALVERGKVAYTFLAQRIQNMAREARAHNGWTGGEVDEEPGGVPFQPPTHAEAAPQRQAAVAAPNGSTPKCPECGGAVWDNTAPGAKKNPKAPDYKCKDKDCAMAAWIGKDGLTWKAPAL